MDWTAGEDKRMAQWRDEYQRPKGKHRAQAPKPAQAGPSLPTGVREAMTTEALLREAAYLRLFETPEDEARADTDEEDDRD